MNNNVILIETLCLRIGNYRAKLNSLEIQHNNDL